MKTIIIGAGRGSRLENLTENEPKSFTRIQDKRILDWILDAHRQNGINDIRYIGGYLIEVVREAYPNFSFCHNSDWPNNNILESLFYARGDMTGGFIASYADILYTPDIVDKLVESKADITVAIDTDWRARYAHRSRHPTKDAEKVNIEGGRITGFNRAIPDHQAFGEFIGVAKFSARGAEIFKQHYDSLPPDFLFENSIPKKRAYLIHYLDYLVKRGVEIKFVTTPGYYIEVDTLEDYSYANKYWGKPNPIKINSLTKNSMTTLFPAGVVGSLPRPRFVQDLILGDTDPFSPAIDAAVLYAVALQESAGLDIISDGEWRRKSYLGAIAHVASGLTHNFKDGRSWHTVTNKLRHLAPGWFAKEAAWLKKHTDKKIKVCLPSPYLLGQRLWDEALSKNAYPAREEFEQALVPILKKEAELLAAAGADIIQIDDPHICLFVDKKVREKYKNPEEELKRACVLVSEVVKDLKGVETALHLCRRNKGRQGWIGEGGYESIIPAISNIPVTQLVLEYSIPVAGDFRALKKLPEKFNIGLGCVDCRFERIETPEEIAARVEKALEFVAPERITLNPDCGFAPGSQAEVPLDEAYLKLKNEVFAAQILRKKFAA